MLPEKVKNYLNTQYNKIKEKKKRTDTGKQTFGRKRSRARD
jgi:hypothetical protein